MSKSEPLYFTEDDEANRLLGENPLALLIGLVLYQQVSVDKAFMGPHVLKKRLGGVLNAQSIATKSPESLEATFQESPAIHRFPTAMAKRVHALCSHLTDEFEGDPAAIWQDAESGPEIIKRIKTLPGFGEYKAVVTLDVLVRRCHIETTDWERFKPAFPTVGDIDGPGQLDLFKERKKAWKALTDMRKRIQSERADSVRAADEAVDNLLKGS
tara:strand:+ start:927 stop:1565 length:639 start_codon:yes stop_codon:yes gene_type:complete